MFKFPIGRRWGLDTNLIIYMYKHILIPSMIYTCFIFAHLIKGSKLKTFNRMKSQHNTKILMPNSQMHTKQQNKL